MANPKATQFIQEPEVNRDVTEPRMDVVLWLTAIIDGCRSIGRHQIRKTIESIFAEIKSPEGNAPTLNEMSLAWKITKSRMRMRLQYYRKCPKNKIIVPYPTKFQGRWVYSDQTRQEYRRIQKMRADIYNGSQRIDEHMMTILNKNPRVRQRELEAKIAEIQQEITVLNVTSNNNKKKRRKDIA